MAYQKSKLQDIKPFDEKKISIVSSDTEYLIPAWCKNRIDFNYDEYIQFVLKEKEMWDAESNGINPDDANGDSCLGNYLNIEKTFCYLCNIQIPLPYINEHLESSKHLTYRKIAEIGMERIKNQMRQNYYIEPPPPSIYFCSTCIVMVAEIDKWQHLKSKSHKNAVILDKILNDFLKVYTNYDMEDEMNTKNETEPEIVTSQSDVNKIVKTELTIDVTNNNNNVQHKNFNAGKNLEDNKDPISNNKVYTQEESDVEKQPPASVNLEDYIKYLDANASTYRLENLDGFYLKIKTHDNVSLKVKHENYHGVISLGTRHVQCKLCMLIFKNLKEHMLSPEHLQKIILPIDKHCIRKLDDTMYHCVICNDLIDNSDVHPLYDKTHNRMLMEAFLFDPWGKDFENETDKTQCKALDDVTDNVTNRHNKTGALPKTTATRKAVQSHHVDAKSRKDRECIETQKKVQPHKATQESQTKDLFRGSGSIDWFDQDLDSYNVFDQTPGNQLKCKVCNITLPIDRNEEHLSDEKHLYAYNALISTNRLQKLPNYFYCQICNTNLLHGNVLDHINSPSHISSFLTIKVMNNQSSVDYTSFEQAGNKEKKTISGNYHDNGYNKISNSDKKINSEKKDKIKEIGNKAGNAADNTLTKTVGNKFGSAIDDATEPVAGNLVDNMANIPQTRENFEPIWYDEFPRKTKAKNKNKAVVSKKRDTGNNIDNNPEGNAQSPKLDADTCKKICKVCSIIILDKPTGITEHVNEGYHKNHISTIEQNRLKLVRNMFICELCHECIPIGRHFNHMLELSHVHYVKTLSNKFPDGVPEIGNNTKLNGDCSIIAVIPPRKYPFYEIMKIQKSGEHKCRVCLTNLQKNSFVFKSHVEETKHKKLLQEILAENLVIEMDDHFNCCLCCKYLPKEMLFDHVRDGRHRTALLATQNLKKMLKGTLVCFLCNEVASPEHNLSLQHQNNSKAMDVNMIIVRGDICFCKACDVYFIYQLIENHINMQNHINLIKGNVV